MASKGSGGMSGVAVAAAATGALLIVAGIKDAPLIDALREILSGKAPTGRAPVVTNTGFGSLGKLSDLTGQTGAVAGPVPSSALGGAIVAAARGWIGVPYKWGGTTRDGVDCSGLVYRCLNAAGVKVSRRTANGYRTWSGAVDIPRSACSPGDLVCYNGHIGIATSRDSMIHAPRPGKTVVERSIYNGQGGPTIRRVRG